MSENNPTFERLRSIAENILRVQADREQADVDSEFKEVLHELQVYQIELELQNEELREAQEELATSRREFSDLFEHAPVAYFTVSVDGVIIKANSTSVRKFGRTKADLEGKPFIELIEINTRDKFYFHRRKLLKSRETQTEELLFIRADGSQFYGQLESVLVDASGDNDIFRIAVTDITQRRLYEQRLQALRELDQAILVSHSADEIAALVLDNVLQVTPGYYACFVDFHAEDDRSVRFAFSQGEPRAFADKQFSAQAFLEFHNLSSDEFYIASTLPILDAVMPTSLAAHLVVPVYQSQRQIGILIVGARLEINFSQEVIRTVQNIALRMGIALQQAHMRLQIQRHTHDLETQVEERTAALQQSEREERKQRVFAEAMLDIVQQLNRSLELDTVLEHILLSLERVIAFDAASIVLVEPKTGAIIKTRAHHQTDGAASSRQQLTVWDFPLYQRMLNTREPVFIPDVTTAADWIATEGHDNVRAYIGVPIIADDLVLGFLNVDKHETGYLSETQFAHLHAFAAQAAVAIKNARAHQREQELAVLEERQRLARDLHDAVSQNLFSVNVMVQTIASQLAGDGYDVAKLREIVGRIVKVADGAQAEMRLLLFELRPTNMEQASLDELLQQLITGLRGRKKIDVYEELAPVPVLPFEQKIMIYRMAQEALNNVSKHARADTVHVSLTVKADSLTLTIEDDGCGFAVDENYQGHGLNILHERATEIDAALTIDSAVGEGTVVRIVSPLLEDDQSSDVSESAR